MARFDVIASTVQGIPVGIGASGFVLRNGADAHQTRNGEASAVSGTANGGVASNRLGFSREPTPLQRQQAIRQESARPATVDDIIVSLGAQLASGEAAYPATTVYGRDGRVAPPGSLVGQQSNQVRASAVTPSLTFTKQSLTTVEATATSAGAVPRATGNEIRVEIPLATGARPLTTARSQEANPARGPGAANNGQETGTDRRRVVEPQAAAPRAAPADQNDATRQVLARAYQPAAQVAAASLNIFV